MLDVISTMLKRYTCVTQEQTINALKEIIQEIALLGLYRAKFFEYGAFYGGTALRILYGLERFSEDLDFSLLKQNLDFNLQPFNRAIKEELSSFGFIVEVQEKIKTQKNDILSAFIKANTKIQILTLKIPNIVADALPTNQNLKIKMEVDIDPPLGFYTTTKTLLLPIPFAVRTYRLEDAFAGKMHAILCRSWKTRVKGRDWYDFVWFVSRNIKLSILHLQYRLHKSDHLEQKIKLTPTMLKEMLMHKINDIDLDFARADILLFIKDPIVIKLWSKVFFRELVDKIEFL